MHHHLLIITIVSAITGALSGILGAGPEVLIVPLLTMFGTMKTIKHRIGTSLFMLLPPIGLFAALNYYNKGFVDIRSALYMALIFTVFASITATYSVEFDEKILQKIFGAFTMSIGIYYFLK